MKRIFQKPHIYWLIGIFIVYIILAVIISGFYKTIPLIITYASAVSWVKLSISLILSLTIGILVSINTVYAFILYKERKQCKNGVTMASVGAMSGLAVGVCPLCVTGLVPLILSAAGISFTFASLPFQGIEIQLIIIFVLLGSLKMLSKKNKI